MGKKYTHSKKEKLVEKINKLTNKEDFINIFKIIKSREDKLTKETGDSILMFFHDLKNETYEEIDNYIKMVNNNKTINEKKVKEYKLTPDGKICETIWEPVPAIEQFLPSIPVVSTTATIAAVATTSALLAKPLADLLLKVVKPVVKKVIAKVQKILGKTPYRPTLSEIQTNQYREKKGMLPLKFGKKKVVSK